MTGTAETEAAEFHSTYKLDVIVIPTHMPMVRKDFSDVIYRTLPEKWDAVVEEIKELHEKGQPVLVGTVSVENSELIARRLQRDRRAAQRSEREVSRTRSRDRRPGRTQRRGHDRHQHGRPRNGHSARRQSRLHGARVSEAARRSIPTKRPKSNGSKSFRKSQAHRRSRAQRSRRRSAACTSSAPNVTNRAASTTSFADAPDARAIPDRRASSFRSKTI